MQNPTTHTTTTRKNFLLGLGTLFTGIFSLNTIKGLLNKDKGFDVSDNSKQKPSFLKLAKADPKAVKYPFSPTV